MYLLHTGNPTPAPSTVPTENPTGTPSGNPTAHLLSSAGQDNLERYEYACEVPHKWFKLKSLSSTQNYLLLSIPLDRSFVLCLFPQNEFSLHVLC